MNRQQAAHLLDAYVLLGEADAKDTDCAWESLREVILDAMTEYKTVTYPITVPNLTNPHPIVTYTDTADPNVVKPSTTTGVS